MLSSCVFYQTAKRRITQTSHTMAQNSIFVTLNPGEIPVRSPQTNRSRYRFVTRGPCNHALDGPRVTKRYLDRFVWGDLTGAYVKGSFSPQ